MWAGTYIMNAVAVIILTAIIIEFVLSFILDFLNLRILRTELPEAFHGIYDEEQYRKSQEYLRVNTRFGWITGTFSMLVILVFWFAKGFPILDHWVRALNQGPVVTGLIYMGILIFFRTLLFLPFGIYDTFVIEERFGFNRTKWSTFIKDKIRYLLLSVVLGVPLLSIVLLFFESAGSHAWWLCWAAVTLYALMAQYIVPTWIMPLFNRFDPLEEGELKTAILSCADAIGFPLENVFVMDSSRRSGKSNAFFTGFGKHKRIVLFDTLTERHSVSELVGVLAHEMGHYKLRHIMQNLIVGVIEMGVMFFLLSIFIAYQGLFDAFYMDTCSVYAGLIFFGMLYAPIDFLVGIFIQMLSRRNEYAADRFAVQATGDSRSLATALKKLSVDNLSNLIPHPWYVFFHYSHPPVLERIGDMADTENFS